MARLSTCKLCGCKLMKEDKHTYSNKTYCKKCLDIKIKESNEYNTLISSICNYFGDDKPTGLVLKQIKDYKETFGYTYSGISYCLWYITDILNKTLDKKYGIALVKYEYENAKIYYGNQEKIRNSIESSNKEVKEIIKKVKINNKSIKHKFLLNLDEVN